jgi:hypothetical protein
MKTSVIMKRFVGASEVRQDSKTGMFNVNDLLSIYNKQGKRQKRIEPYMRRKESKELIEAILKRLNSYDNNSCYLDSDIIRTAKGRVNGGTWMHPYMFIDFAMWLSPDFKVMCIEWIYDQVIELRNQVWDDYKELTSAIKTYLQPTTIEIYKDEISMINKIVFGKSESDLRQIATQEQLKLLKALQKADVKLIAEWKSYSQRLASLCRLKELL